MVSEFVRDQLLRMGQSWGAFFRKSIAWIHLQLTVSALLGFVGSRDSSFSIRLKLGDVGIAGRIGTL